MSSRQLEAQVGNLNSDKWRSKTEYCLKSFSHYSVARRSGRGERVWVILRRTVPIATPGSLLNGEEVPAAKEIFATAVVSGGPNW